MPAAHLCPTGSLRTLVWLCAVVLLAPTTGRTQERQESPAASFQPTLHAGDLWHALRHGRADPLAGDPVASAPTPPRDHFFVIAPTIASKPSTGLSVGLNSDLAFFRGDEKTTHIPSISDDLRAS